MKDDMIDKIVEGENKQEVHEFHFMMGETMITALKKLTVFNEFLGFSGIIVKILSLLAPVSKREHEWGEQRMSRYRYVSADPDEKRKHVHVYLDEDVYRELKLLHQDLNFYSISQIIRGLLELFLDLVDEYGDNTLEELKKIFKEWEEVPGCCRQTLCGRLRQLWVLAHHITDGKRIIVLYDEHFSPLWLFRI